MSILDSLAIRLKDVRISSGMNQTDFADKLGVKQSYLSAMERGVRPVPTKIADALIEQFGVSQDWLFSSNINNSKPVVVPQKGTPDGTPLEKVHKRGTTLKLTKTSRIRGVKAENEALTPEEEARREAGEKWYTRRITESRLYKRHPEAESEGMTEALAASVIGTDSDSIVRHLHDTTYNRVDQVLDQVAVGTLTMSEGASQIKAITEPLDKIKDYFTAIETAIINMTDAAFEYFPEVLDVAGHHLRAAMLEAAERTEQLRRAEGREPEDHSTHIEMANEKMKGQEMSLRETKKRP